MQKNNIPNIETPPTVAPIPAPVDKPIVDREIPRDIQQLSKVIRLNTKIAARQTDLDNTLQENKVVSNFNSIGKDTRIQTTKHDITSDAYAMLNSGKMIPRFEKYMPGINNEEILANTQSRGEKWKHGLTKLGGKIGTAVLGGTLGLIDGVMHAAKEGSFSAVYDSDFNHFLDDLNTKMDYKLPNYYTQQEKHMNFGQKMGTANFWANDFTGGLSFMLGTIVSEGMWAYATGGTSLIARGAMLTRAMTKNLGRKAFTALNVMKAPTKNLLRGSAMRQADDIVAAGTRAGRLAKGLETSRFLATSAGYEAGVEARGYMTETTMEWQHQFERQYGRMPSAKELAEFKDGITTSANWLFMGNTALVGFSNYTVLGKLLLNPAPTRQLSNSMFKKVFLGMGFTKKAPGKLAAIEANNFQKVFGKAYSVGKPMVTEGVIEEGGQAVMSKGAAAYVLSAYDEEATHSNLSMLGALQEGLKYTYTTKEGLTEVGLGALIGLFGGGIATKGRFNEVSTEKKDIESTIKVINAFTQENLITQFKSASKIAVADKKGSKARAEGNMTEAHAADLAASLAVIERSHHYQSTEELLKDFNTAIDVMDTAELAKELGVTETEAREWKNTRKADFASTAERHTKNLEFAEVYVGDTQIAGLKDLEGTPEGVRNVTDLKAAVAYTLTMGVESDIYTENLALQIKAMIANNFDSTAATDAITVQDVLRKVAPEKAQAYKKQAKAVTRAEERLRALEQAKVQTELLEDKEDNTAKANKLLKLNKKILKAKELYDKLRQEKEMAYIALNIPQFTDEIITEEMLDNQAKNVKALEARVKDNSIINPQDTVTLTHLIEEYHRASKSYTTYNHLVKSLVNQDTRVNLLNGWLAQIINRKKKVKGDTAALFADMLTNYQLNMSESVLLEELRDIDGTPLKSVEESKTLEEDAQDPKDTTKDPLDTPPEDITKPEETTPPAPPIPGAIGTVIQKLKAQVDRIINQDKYSQNRYGYSLDVNLEDVQPTKEEVAEYDALLGKIKNSSTLTFNTIIRKGYNAKNKTGLTKVETERFIALNSKLNNWKILSGLNRNDSSISEILQIIDQLEKATGVTEINPNVIPEDLFKPDTSKGAKGGKSGASLHTIVTPDIAVAKKIKDNNTYEISFLSPTSLPRLIPGSTLKVVIDGKLVDVNTIPADKLNNLTKEGGTEFVLEVGDKKVTVTISNRQRIIVDAAVLEELMPTSNFKILDFGNSNFMPLFIKNSEGNFEPLDGDFLLTSVKDNEVITLESAQLQALKSGTILDTVVNLNDSYNVELLAKYKAGVITKEELTNNINIYITKQGAVNNILGTLRAIKPDTNADTETFAKIYMLRKQAVKKMLKAKNSRVKVGITVTYGGSTLGSPNLVVSEENGELVPKNIKLTNEATKQVDDFGYMLDGKLFTNMIDGKLFTNKNLQYSEKELKFATKVSEKAENVGKKVPVVIFKYENKVVVFPVSLNKTESIKVNKVDRILNNPGLSDAAKILELNEFLIQNNINPNDYAIHDLESPDSIAEVDRLVKDLAATPEFANVEDWVKPGFVKDDLQDAVEIAIDITNKPFNAGTGLLNLSEMGIPTEEDLMIEAVDSLDNYAKKLSNLFRESEPFKVMPFREWDFYLKFEDRDVKLDADTFMNKESNAHILIRAFKTKIPKQLAEFLGADLIRDIRIEIKQYEVLQKGIKVNKAAIDTSLKADINKIEKDCK